MSVSLALIPVALTLRLVMGQRNFSKWVDSMQDKIPTSFRNETELVRTVHKAGFDTEKWGGSIKTHIDEQFYFFWEYIDGQWLAVFAKSDDKVIIERFAAEINRAAGRHVFGESGSVQQAEQIAAAQPARPVAERKRLRPRSRRISATGSCYIGRWRSLALTRLAMARKSAAGRKIRN